MKKIAYYILFLVSIAFVYSASAENPYCIKDSEKELVINWGNQYNHTGGKIYHSINAKLELFRIEEDSLGNKKIIDSTKIDEKDFCRIKNELMNLMVKTQALYYPGTVQQFVEYKSPKQNVYFRAIWSIEHTDFGNKKLMKAFYDSLNYLTR